MPAMSCCSSKIDLCLTRREQKKKLMPKQEEIMSTMLCLGILVGASLRILTPVPNPALLPENPHGHRQIPAVGDQKVGARQTDAHVAEGAPATAFLIGYTASLTSEGVACVA